MAARTKQQDPNDKQVRFVDEYFVDFNVTKAAERAGYSKKSAHVQGHALLKNPKVKRLIADRRKALAGKAELKAKDIRRELALIGTSDIRKLFDEKGNLLDVHKLPDSIAPAIASIEVETKFDPDLGETTTTKKVKFWEKTKSLELYMKHLGLLVERQKVEHTIKSFEQLVLESLKADAQPPAAVSSPSEPPKAGGA